MELTPKISKNNYYAFLWHAVFLALAVNFTDVNTIIPAMMVDAGGSPFLVGLLTAMLVGGGKISQLLFTPFLSKHSFKRRYLLTGINFRIITLFGMAILFYFSFNLSGNLIILLIFLLISIFAVSGAFAGISYTDILGKSVLSQKRKSFFSIKQVISSLFVLLSAYFARKILISFGYPISYSVLFCGAAIFLLIASLGFWKINEIAAGKFNIKSPSEFLRIIIKEIRTNKKLANYLLILNTQGLTLSLMPFLILYANKTFGASGGAIGNYLVLKVVGSVVAGSAIFYYTKKIKYQSLLYSTSILAISIPLFVLIFPGKILFPYIFLAGGVVFTLNRISIGGILLEVSNNDNRALYTGLTGAGSIIPAIFPLFGGWIITAFGFPYLFILFILIILISFLFIYKLDCQK